MYKLANNEIAKAFCNCPYRYEYGGDCKHIVAVVLSYIANYQDIQMLPDLNSLLMKRTKADLADMLETIVSYYPELLPYIEDPSKGIEPPFDDYYGY